jgi:hypothetical protein
MNVENRKLFANRDARKRLAEMGGILASSPELMGEAMKFANGGGGELSYIVSNIPGLVAQYEYVRVDVPTMQMLNDRFPQLMQQATVEEESMAPSAVRTRARPQTILGTRIGRMMETQQAAPEEVVLESAPITSGEQPSLMDRIRTTVPGLSQYEGQPNPYVEALKNAGLSEDALLTGSVTPSEELMSMGPMEMERLSKQPILQQELAKAVLSQQPEVPSAKDLMAGPIYPAEETLMSMNRGEDPASLRQIQVQGMPFLVNERTNQVFTMDMDPILSTDARSKMVTEFMSSADFKQQEAERLKNEASIAQQQQQKVVEDQTFDGVPLSSEAAANLAAAEKRVSEASEAASAASEGDLRTRAQEMADAERKQMTGMPDLAAPEKVDVDVLLDAVEKNDPKAASAALMKSITGVDVHGGTTPPPSDDTPDAPKPDAPKTRKQRMLETVDMISEMFGIREKDKAEDMYDLMATIGFAMASGESPNAMKNIADAFLVGAQMKRADKKEDKKLDQAIRTLAVKDVLEQESDERALEQLLAKETRQDSRALALYAEKLRIKEQMDPTSPAGRYLSSELGDAVLGIYADVLKDETISPDDKGAEFFKRAGEKNATQFLGLTGFSAMGGGVGAGVTPTQSKLDFGESD